MDAAGWEALGTILGVAVALALGVIGVVQASKAKRFARKANKIASNANKLAHQQAKRDNERHDVSWDWRWDNDTPEHVIVQYIGKSRAKNVVAQFTLDGVTEAAELADVDGRIEFRIEIPDLAEARMRVWEQQEIARLSADTYVPTLVATRLRVMWATHLATEKSADSNVLPATLAPFPRPRYAAAS